MKLVMSVDEFADLLKTIPIPAISGRKVSEIKIPGRYSASSDVVIEFEDAEIAIPEPAPIPLTPPSPIAADDLVF